MYNVYCDENLIYDVRSNELALISPRLVLEDSKAGVFDFTVTPKHPYYDSINKMSSEIIVKEDGIEIFSGRVSEETCDLYKRKTIHCEGELAYLNDSIQEPAEYHNMTVRGYLEKLISIHNAKVDDKKRFKVGIVTVMDSNDSLYRYTNWESTLSVIKTDLMDSLGGHLRVRKENGIRYLDFLAEYPNTNSQEIRFGENLLDFSKNFDMSDLATVIIPLGAKREESPIAALEAYTMITSMNDGKNYLQSDEAVKKYGRIEKVIKWDDVTVPENLKAKGQKYLKDTQFENMVLEVKAVDMHFKDANFEPVKLLDSIRVVSIPHGLDRFFPVTKLSIPLNQPSNAAFTLGTNVRLTLTDASKKENSELKKFIETIPSKSEILKEAEANATALITAATNGYVVVDPNEILVMDTPDKRTAKRVWRWNVNGLGYSSTGYKGPFGTAVTMNGQILGKYIMASSITADKIVIENLVSRNGNFKIDEEGSMIATNGTFAGTVRGADIIGSNFRFENKDGSIITLSGNGLIVDSTNAKEDSIFKRRRGRLSLSTMNATNIDAFSPILYTDENGESWWGAIAKNVNSFRFVFNALNDSYIQVSTLYGAYGITTWASDRKMKQNIKDSCINASEQIMSLRHRSFDWKKTDRHVDCGYVAQELMEINPAFVLNMDDTDMCGNKTGENRYQVDERGLIPVMTKAMQEILERLGLLEMRVNEVEKRVKNGRYTTKS